MPHEKIKSSILNDEHIIQVMWKPASTGAHAYSEPEPGYVQLMTERPGSEARFPSPQVIELPARHVFESSEDVSTCVRCGLEETAYEVHRPDSIRGTDKDPLMKSLTGSASKPVERVITGTSTRGVPRWNHVPTAESISDSTGDDSDSSSNRIEYTAGENTWSEPCTGFTITLERDDINRLIRMLRRARDSAFEADA